METLTISVFNIVGNPFCVEADDGQKVYEMIKEALQKNRKVKVSFQNVEMLTSAFLNTAIGQLYKDYSEIDIKKNLSVDNMLREDAALLKRVVNTAKLYYNDPEKMEKSISDILGE